MAETVNSIGAGQTYTTLAAWEAARQGSISVGDQEVGEIHGNTSGTGNVTISGWTMGDSTSRIILRNSSGGKHTGTPGTGDGLIYTGTIGELISNANATTINLTIQGLEIYSTYASKNNATLRFGASASDYLVDSCLCRSESTTAPHSAVATETAGNSVECRNTVFWGFGYAVYGRNSVASAEAVVNNCTAHGAGGISYLWCTTTNCFGTDGANRFFQNNAASDYNISSDATAPGANSATGKDQYGDYFTDFANGDFSLKDTTFNLVGQAGTPISGITVDIVGNPRDGTNPDIGAFEFAVAPPAGIIPQIMHHRQQQGSA